MNKIMILHFRPFIPSFIKSEKCKSLFTSFHPAVVKEPKILWSSPSEALENCIASLTKFFQYFSQYPAEMIFDRNY